MLRMAVTILEMAAQLCRDFPNVPSLTLAKRLYAENKEHIASIESARSSVRKARGNHGDRVRKLATVPRVSQKAGWKPACPPSLAEPWVPFDLGDGCCVLSISDCHIPYHDLCALEAVVKFAKRRHR